MVRETQGLARSDMNPRPPPKNQALEPLCKQGFIFVAPALAGRHRRASFRPFVRSFVRPSVRPSIRQHLTWVSCERNSSCSFAPIVLKLCMCFPRGMRMCMWIGHNCWISFCHFFDIVNIFHPDYIDRGYIL